MRLLALATDYDGTIAREGRVDEATLAALARFRRSGRRLVLVTGRELEELLAIFPEVGLFDRVVAENGALLYRPEDQAVRVLGGAPPWKFVQRLEARGVGPISVGRVVVATWQPHEVTVRQVIRELGLDLEVVLNKRAVMVLPRGVNKASGLAAALDELGLSPKAVAGVGDAENDLDFLASCGLSAAVANALEPVKAHVDLVLSAGHGRGVIELVERLESGAAPLPQPGP
jgi:hydroxymethylpyrimidine pyrophosphatase-like HAD family hydrolase